MDANPPQSKHKTLALPDLKAHLIFWPLAAAGLVLDLWTKKEVFAWLENRQSFSVIDGYIELVRALNDGAAWGLFSGNKVFLAAISIIALAAVLVIFFFSDRQPRLVHIALGFFAAGVSGNLFDRVFNGGLVRDFINVSYHSYHWPAFNLADSFLCVGVGLLMGSMIWDLIVQKLAQKRAQQQK
jgi:signal peptidase II